MALCSSRGVGFLAPPGRLALGNDRNVKACPIRASRSRLQTRGALRNESMPKKKHKEREDLLAELEDEIQPFLELKRESAMRLRTMKHYEIMYLVHEAKVGELQEIANKFKDFVKEKKGRIWRFNDWGMRRLAYKIKKTWRANYILMNIEVGSEYINELNAMLEKDERIIRHMITTRKKAFTNPTVPPEEPPPSRAELLEAEIAAETAAEEAAEREEREAKAAKRKARKEAARIEVDAQDEEDEDEEEQDDMEDINFAELRDEDDEGEQDHVDSEEFTDEEGDDEDDDDNDTKTN